MIRLKFLRIERGLTQRELADRTQINHSQLCLIESGRLNPRPQELARLADALGCLPERLLEHVIDPMRRSEEATR